MTRDEFDLMAAPDDWPPKALDTMPIPSLDDYGPVLRELEQRDRAQAAERFRREQAELARVAIEAAARAPTGKVGPTWTPTSNYEAPPLPMYQPRLPAKRRLNVTMSDKGWRLTRMLSTMRMKRRDLESSLLMGRAIYK